MGFKVTVSTDKLSTLSSHIFLVLVTSFIALQATSIGCWACREPSEVLSLRLSENQQTEADYIDDSHVLTRRLNTTGCPTRSRRGRACDCPTMTVANIDENRIPKMIIQTSCCNVNNRVIGRSGWITFCRNVTHNVQVFRRGGCHLGVYQYRREPQQIPVGCSCSSDQI